MKRVGAAGWLHAPIIDRRSRLPSLPCPETAAVIAAVRAGTLTRTPRLAAHLQVCSHCLGRVFGDVRRARAVEGATTAPRDPDE